MNPDQLPSVSTFRVEKPGKSKFAPSIGGRKPTTATTSNTATSTVSTTVSATETEVPATVSTVNNTVTSEALPTISAVNVDLVENISIETVPLTKESASTTVGKKIESIQSRRMAASVPSSAPLSKEDIKLPAGPKDAASIATVSSANVAEKRTMAYFLKDSGEGREMPSSQGNSNGSGTSDPSLSPSKTRRIVNLRNIKAPPRSAATSTALAPQVRVVDGAIVYDEKFSAAISMPSNSSTADLEHELEYVDEDDENGKHLTSATYSTKAKGSNRWNAAETDLFYEALSMCGTDFSMIQTLIPHRTRTQIKGKYKLEEKSNLTRINLALKSKKAFDPTFKDRVKEFTESHHKK